MEGKISVYRALSKSLSTLSTKTIPPQFSRGCKTFSSNPFYFQTHYCSQMLFVLVTTWNTLHSFSFIHELPFVHYPHRLQLSTPISFRVEYSYPVSWHDDMSGCVDVGQATMTPFMKKYLPEIYTICLNLNSQLHSSNQQSLLLQDKTVSVMQCTILVTMLIIASNH